MEKLKENIIKIYGSRGESWIAGLPRSVDQLKTAWGLSKLKPLSNLSYSYVLEGFQGESPIVLKLSPDADLTEKEARTLDAFKGFGAVAVFGHKDGALLLERAVPGTLLKNSLLKENRIEIACKVMERLHQAFLPPKGLFPHIEEWLAAVDKEWDLSRASGLSIGFLPQEIVLSNPSALVREFIEGDSLSDLEKDMAACLEDPGHLSEWAELHEKYEQIGGYRWVPIEQVLRGLKLESSLLDLPISSLSSGQRVRAALAKALIENPDLLLLDEPRDRNIMAYDKRGEKHQKSLQHKLDAMKTRLEEIEADLLSHPKPKSIRGLKFAQSHLASSVAIELDHAGKSYGSKVLFSGFCKSICKGERILVTGPNGCGKTTLLKAIAGIIPLDKGSIRSAPTAKIAFLDQEVELLPMDQTPLQYFESWFHIDEETLRRELHKAALGGADLLRRSFSTLSTGQRKRMMLLALVLSRGRVPFLAHVRVTVPLCPTLASS